MNYFYRYNNIAMLEPQLLASLIRKHRKAAGLSQLQLAEMAGVGKTSVFDLEKGKETIQLDTLRKILTALNIKLQLISPFMNQIADHEKG
jgi:HTH-type transcriptional regulator/antitoxin HipB